MKINLIQVFFSICSLWIFAGTQGSTAAETMRHGDLTQTNDFIAAANIAGEMEAFTDADGGVYALKVRVQNLSSTNDIILRVIDVPEAWFVVRVGEAPSDASECLTKPFPKLKGYEYNHVEIPLERGASIEWFIRLKDRLENPLVLPEKTSAYLTVLLLFSYSQEDFSQAPSRNFQRSELRFYRPQIVVTKKALDGDPTEKYERTLKAVSIAPKK